MEIAAYTCRYSRELLPKLRRWNTATLLIGCVDNAAARLELAQSLEEISYNRPPLVWWLDSGNHREGGQVLLGNAPSLDSLSYAFWLPGNCLVLPSPALQHPELLEAKPEEEEEQTSGEGRQLVEARLSCAELALLNAQSLTINQAMAATCADYVLRLLVTKNLQKFSTYLDLPSGVTRSQYNTPQAIAHCVERDPTTFFKSGVEVVSNGGGDDSHDTD